MRMVEMISSTTTTLCYPQTLWDFVMLQAGHSDNTYTYEYKWRSIVLLFLFWIPIIIFYTCISHYLVLCKNSTYHNICHTYENISYVSSSSIIRFQLPKVSGLQWYQTPYILTIRLSTVADCEHMMCHVYILVPCKDTQLILLCDVYVSTSSSWGSNIPILSNQ